MRWSMAGRESAASFRSASMSGRRSCAASGRDERLRRLREDLQAAALVVPTRQRTAEPGCPKAGGPLAAQLDELGNRDGDLRAVGALVILARTPEVLDVSNEGRVRTQAGLEQVRFGDADVLVGDCQVRILQERQTQ